MRSSLKIKERFFCEMIRTKDVSAADSSSSAFGPELTAVYSLAMLIKRQ